MFLSPVPNASTKTSFCCASGRPLPDRFYCKKPQQCPEPGCQSTTTFEPRTFTKHMQREHGDPKDLECTEHEACQAKEPKTLYNAFSLRQHIYSQNRNSRKQPYDHHDCHGSSKQYAPGHLKHSSGDEPWRGEDTPLHLA